MSFLLPLAALVLALLARLTLSGSGEKSAPFVRLVPLTVLVIVAGGAVARFAPEVDRNPAIVSILIGAIVVASAAYLARPVGALALGLAGASGLHLLSATALPTTGPTLLIGAGLAVLTVGGETAALAAAIVVAADNLGMRHSDVPAAAYVGSQLGLAFVVGGYLAAWIPEKLNLLKPLVPGIVLLLGALIVSKTTNNLGLATLAGIGALTGVVLYAMQGDESDNLRVGLGAIAGVALGTVAFALDQAAGMAIALLAAMGTLLAVGDRRNVLALGPLLGLVLFRVLREAGTGATRALDIGQHYTLLALVVGLVIAALPFDWQRGRKAQVVGSGLWGLLAIATPPFLVAALGMRGSTGLVVGLGVAGLLQTARGKADLRPLALGAGLSAATILCLDWMGDDADLARDVKLRMLGYAAVAAVVIAVALAAAGRRRLEESTEEVPA